MDTTPSSSRLQKGRKSLRVVARKRLNFSLNHDQPPPPPNPWSEEENKALVEFILFHGTGDKWPSHSRSSNFWSEAATFVHERSRTTKKRSGEACRLRTNSRLKKQYCTPIEAEQKFFGMEQVQVHADEQRDEVVHITMVTTGTQTISDEDAGQQQNIHTMEPSTTDISEASRFTLRMQTALDMYPVSVQLQILTSLFQRCASQAFHVTVPNNFLTLVLKASQHLSSCNRSNVLYGLAQALGRMRPDGSDSRLPARRMPMGLLEFTINFFNADTLSEVPSCPIDYRMWLTTMYSHFGNKWCNLHLGPAWSVVMVGQGSQPQKKRLPIEARVNIPGISSRTLRRDISAAKVTTNAEIQIHVLDEAAKHHPNEWWWLKGDGCDLVVSLGESVKGVWSGDVDLNDGCLQAQIDAYKKRLDYIEEIKSKEPSHTPMLLQQLENTLSELKKDLTFIHRALEEEQSNYERKQSSKAPEKELLKIAWKITEKEELLKICRQLIVDIEVVMDKVKIVANDVESNIARSLTLLRSSLTDFVKKLSKHQRTPATHIFVFMISPESRNKKPYALPVQCLPIGSLKDKQVRGLADKVINEMIKRNMKVAGFTTNGEFNSLRWKGSTRPLTILQLRSDARKKFANRGLRPMLDMLTPIVYQDGSIRAKRENPCVSEDLLREIHGWMLENASLTDVLVRLRQRTTPDGYPVKPWQPGKTETIEEMLRSILAQLYYRKEVLEWEKRGVPFKTRAYVPEEHTATGLPFHEREDEAHVFKRIALSLRNGGPKGLQLQRFVEAMYDSETRLSYHALIGTRKQSVSDVEKIFSESVLKFLEGKGYEKEATYVRVIMNWRKASDMRGLSDEQREKYNKEFMDYILDELMPWHKDQETRDFSLMEVNQDVTSIRGFTRETLSALIVDIESRDWRRAFNKENQIPPEHPRSSTTDDVECFFSVLRDMVGKDFTLKEVMYGWRKATDELTKRLDPSLPFYYHTSTHQRFYEGAMPDFSQGHKQKKKRVPERELLVGNVGGRVTMAQRGATSIRAQFHNKPVELPPPPSTVNPTLMDHSYV